MVPGKDVAVLGPIAYLVAWVQGPGLGPRDLSLGLAGFSFCWADFPLLLREEPSEAHHGEKSERDAVTGQNSGSGPGAAPSLPGSVLLTSLLMPANYLPPIRTRL